MQPDVVDTVRIFEESIECAGIMMSISREGIMDKYGRVVQAGIRTLSFGETSRCGLEARKAIRPHGGFRHHSPLQETAFHVMLHALPVNHVRALQSRE